MSAAPLRVREHAGKDGFVEIAVYDGDALLGIVIRPCSGAKWFLHLPRGGLRGIKHQSRKKALAAGEAPKALEHPPKPQRIPRRE